LDLNNFFEITNPSTQSVNKKIETTTKINETKEKAVENNEKIKPITNRQIINIGEDVEKIFLLDVVYEPTEKVAQCIFYNESNQSLYRWNDTSNHKPYLITLISPENIPTRVTKSKDLIKIEQVQKYLPLEEETSTLTKVYGDNPLTIGGKNSFREFIGEKYCYEADIRYHLNYIADKKLTPGTYYQVKNGELLPLNNQLSNELRTDVREAFKGESQQQLDMLEDYMPLLFQDFPNIYRAAFDIEVNTQKNTFPNIANPEHEIISIALVDNTGRQICWIYNRKEVDDDVHFEDVEIRRFDREADMLLNFFEVVDEIPIIFTYNGDNFDCPYLINRAKKLQIDADYIPFISKRSRNDVAMKSAIHIDLYLFFRQASIRLYAFGGKYEKASLDSISNALLGENKIDITDRWISDMNFKELVTYNVYDAKLTLQLTEFDDAIVMNLMFILMRICKMSIFDFTRTAVSGWLKMWLIYEHRKRNYLIPSKQEILSAKGSTAMSDAVIDGKKFQGAIVLDPTPGVWWDVHVLDFASLYPSIIKTKNLSYETIRCVHQQCRTNLVPEVGHWVCTKKTGLFSIVLGFIRETRVKWFKPRSTSKNPNLVERRNNDVIQSSLKVLINAGYGVFGSEAFDFYCPPVAESTTAFARDAITATRDFVEQTLGIKVLYGDTDSVFLYQPTKENINVLLEWGMKNIGIELGTDYEFRYVVFTDRKKNYFGITKRGGMIVKGLMGKKSNTPRIIRYNFQKMLEILKDVHNTEDFEGAKLRIKKLLQTMIQKLETGNFSVNEASIRMTLSKKLKEYDTWTQTIQAIVQLLDFDKDKKFEVGDTIEFIKLKKPIYVKIPELSDLSFPSETRSVSVKPVELVSDDENLDGKPIIDVAESTFSQILTSIGLSWDEVMGLQSLNDFFS